MEARSLAGLSPQLLPPVLALPWLHPLCPHCRSGLQAAQALAHAGPSSQTLQSRRLTYPGGPQPQLRWSEEGLGGGQHSFSARTRAWRCRGRKCSSRESRKRGAPHPPFPGKEGPCHKLREGGAESAPALAPGSQEMHPGPSTSGAWNPRPGSPTLPPSCGLIEGAALVVQLCHTCPTCWVWSRGGREGPGTPTGRACCRGLCGRVPLALHLCNLASLATEPGKWAPGLPHRKDAAGEALPRAQQGPP